MISTSETVLSCEFAAAHGIILCLYIAMRITWIKVFTRAILVDTATLPPVINHRTATKHDLCLLHRHSPEYDIPIASIHSH